ncbi:MAG: hypothetical protein ACJ8AP_07685 [Gemmatimonadales bacterium]
MNRKSLLLAALCCSLGCADSGSRQKVHQQPSAPAPPASDWQVSLRSGNGPLTPEGSEVELRERYGPSAVDSVRIELGEGETTPGTVLYPGDSLRRAEIVWKDTVSRRGPARVILRGTQSKWQVGQGISLGSSLQELERLNGRPFVLAGFGWDYAGVITDWKGGALDSTLAGVKLYLDPGSAQQQSAAYSQVLGDRDYSSDLPAMQQLNPKVAQIFVDFE